MTGFIYHGGNVDQLVEKIQRFLAMQNADRKQMGLKGRKKIETEFSREIVVKAYLKEINRLVRSDRGIS